MYITRNAYNNSNYIFESVKILALKYVDLNYWKPCNLTNSCNLVIINVPVNIISYHYLGNQHHNTSHPMKFYPRRAFFKFKILFEVIIWRFEISGRLLLEIQIFIGPLTLCVWSSISSKYSLNHFSSVFSVIAVLQNKPYHC